MKICPACAHRFEGAEWKCPRCEWTAVVEDGVHSLLPPATDGAPGYEAGILDELDTAERGHFWFAGRTALIALVLDRFFPATTSFLDVGSGTGHLVAALRSHRPSMRCTAVEAFMSGLQLTARRAADIELVQADALHLPYDAEFDVAGAFDVIEHIEDDAAALGEMARAVRPGGGLIVTVPQHQFLWSPFDDYARHQRRYGRRQLARLLQRAGCDVVFATSFVSLLLPAMFASRVIQRTDPDDPLAEFRISRLANHIGRTAMTLERQLIRWGVSLPFGGSLLMVARKKGRGGVTGAAPGAPLPGRP